MSDIKILNLSYGNFVSLDDYMKLQQENKILKDNAENNDKVVDNIRWENRQLKVQLEYLRSGEYLIQLKFERDMLQDLVDDKKISNKEYTIKKLMSGNTMLAEQLKQRDEVIDEAIGMIDKLDSDIMQNTIIGFHQFIPRFYEIKDILQKYEGDNNE